jgi:hypothetical protein
MNWVPDLPEEPIDGYELRYWCYNGYNMEPPVFLERAVYHVDTPAKEVTTDARNQPFTDQWSLHRGGKFVGSFNQWETPKRHADKRRLFPTRLEALEYARGVAVKNVIAVARSLEGQTLALARINDGVEEETDKLATEAAQAGISATEVT